MLTFATTCLVFVFAFACGRLILTYEITDGLQQAQALLTTTTGLGETDNATFTVDFAVDVQGNEAYVYELAPNNGIAAYKYTFTPAATGVQTAMTEQLPVARKVMTSEGLRIEVGESIYSALGERIR